MNAEYTAFKEGFGYDAGTKNYPVVNTTVAEATAYCDWLTVQDNSHIYRLSTDEECILRAGHMPKDVTMNSGYIRIRINGGGCLCPDDRSLRRYRLLGQLLGMDLFDGHERFVHYQRRSVGF